MQSDNSPQYWKNIATHDIDTVDLLLREKGHIDITIYHMHQAIEKILKGLIISQGEEIIFIHDLKRLYAILCKVNTNFIGIEEDIINLQNFYKDLRYPSSDSLDSSDLESAKDSYNSSISFLFNNL
jgi:HEPN domain-containing protein